MRLNQLHTATEALGFLVQFAQADLQQTPPRQLARIERSVQTVIARASPARRQKIEAWDRRTLGVLQRRVLGVLGGLARRRHFAVAGDLVLTFWAIRDGAGFRIEVGGTPLDRLLYQTIRLLEVVGPDKILACASCGRIFLKVTKKRFCSTRCQSRVYMRQLRAAERAEDDAFLARKNTR